MKRFLLFATACLLSVASFAQLPDTEIKDIKTGQKVAFNDGIEKGKITMISFWATWCGPCRKEIKNVNQKMADWKKEVDFNYVAISMDGSRNEAAARGYVISEGWEFPAYIDLNSDLMRSLNFNAIPYTIIIDQEGNVAYKHTDYKEGNEEEYIEKIKELAKK